MLRISMKDSNFEIDMINHITNDSASPRMLCEAADDPMKFFFQSRYKPFIMVFLKRHRVPRYYSNGIKMGFLRKIAEKQKRVSTENCLQYNLIM